MTTFNIGSQNAGSIQNVGGDMVVRGGIRERRPCTSSSCRAGWPT